MRARVLRLVGLVSMVGVLSCADDGTVGVTSFGSTGNMTTTNVTSGIDSSSTSTVDDTLGDASAGSGSSSGLDSSTGAPPECTPDDAADTCDDDDPCTADDCVDGSCTHDMVDNDTPCPGRGGRAGSCQGGECVVDCTTDADCDDSNACTVDQCNVSLGQCEYEELDGVPAPAKVQTAGDCLEVQCVMGAEMDLPDDTDIEDDGIECTDDVCNAGVPEHPNTMAGSPCGSSMMCDGAGACVDCISPRDCTMLPPDDDCQTRTCVAGVCGQDFSAQGTVTNDTLQTDGDCQLIVCDGAGGTESQDDDADLPVDGLECTDDLCLTGVPANLPVTEGTACGAAGLCDDSGQCVGCLTPADCGGSDTFCQTITCINNVCGVDNTPGGTPLPAADQSDNDCQEVQCDGAGGTQAVADDADLPLDDGNDCTEDICAMGMEQHPDEPVNTTCSSGGGVVCDGAGTCVGCNTNNQCSGATQCNVAVCSNNFCTTQPSAAGTPCSDGFFCTATDTCNGAGACVGAGNPCPGPDADGDCSETCNEASDMCNLADPAGTVCDDGLFCTTNDVCDESGTCTGGGSPCPGPDGDADCVESCDEGTDSCTAPDFGGSTCNDGLFCTVTDTCNGAGVCLGTGSPCPGPDGDANCSESCDDVFNTCGAPDPVGAACSDGLFCTATDTCNAAGLCEGVGDPCVNVGDGDSNCSEACDEGANSCSAPDPTGSACNDGLFCTVTDTCNATGTCVGSGTPCNQAGDGDGNCSESCNEAADNCTAPDITGSPCDDGLFCNGDDTCNAAGSCGTHVGNPCSIDTGNNDCTESCREAFDDCQGNNPSGTVCTDGQFCNGTDTCNGSGSCATHSGNPCINVGDGDGNCSEACDEGSDSCTGPDPVGSACNDNLFCTVTDTCNGAGVCSGTGNPCTQVGDNDCDCTESCNEASNNCTATDPDLSNCGGTGINDGVCEAGICLSIICPPF